MLVKLHVACWLRIDCIFIAWLAKHYMLHRPNGCMLMPFSMSCSKACNKCMADTNSMSFNAKPLHAHHVCAKDPSRAHAIACASVHAPAGTNICPKHPRTAAGNISLALPLLQVQTRLEVEVRGGKALRLPIHGDAVLPAVDIKEAELAFGDVYTGVTVRRSLTVINTSPVPASEFCNEVDTAKG